MHRRPQASLYTVVHGAVVIFEKSMTELAGSCITSSSELLNIDGDESGGALLPGLPDSVVLDCVVPWIPWYSRVTLTATSRAWKHALRRAACEELTSRAASRVKKAVAGLVIVHDLPKSESEEYFKKLGTRRRMPKPHAISILEHDVRSADQGLCTDYSWRRLPPIPMVTPLRVLQDCGVVCSNGKIFAIGGWDPHTGAVSGDVYMLDVAAGQWQWEAKSCMSSRRAFLHCKASAGKILVVGGASELTKSPDPEVYDVATDTWELLPGISSTSRSFHFNGLREAMITGGSSLMLLIAHGFCTADGGALVNFRCVFDALACRWGELELCVTAHYTTNDEIVRWYVQIGWDRSLYQEESPTFYHVLRVDSGSTKLTHLFATMDEGQRKGHTLWRGDLNAGGHHSESVSWRQIQLPGGLSMCSEMCYLGC